MTDMSVRYLGMKLKNPLILGSSTLTRDVDKLIEAEAAGAAAVVLKSLFEEELRASMGEGSDAHHPEGFDASVFDAGLIYGSREYIDFIKAAKKAVSIPVIASVNCTGDRWWVDYAKDIAAAGADALELNISFVPFDDTEDPAAIEKKYVDIVSAVRNAIDIPIAAKIGQNFTSIPRMVKSLERAGADAVVLFSRYWQVGLDLDTLSLMPVNFYTTEAEFSAVFRWVAVINRVTGMDISASGGVHDADAFVSAVLAGAATVQVTSKAYLDGIPAIADILDGARQWFSDRGYAKIDDVQGLLSSWKIDEMKSFERLQYLKVAAGQFDKR